MGKSDWSATLAQVGKESGQTLSVAATRKELEASGRKKRVTRAHLQRKQAPGEAWAEAARIVFAFTPNSAAAERVFSMLKAMFGDQQMETLADIIQTALMLRVNKHNVG